MNRAELAKALAKMIAFYNCGKLETATLWAQQIVDALRKAGLRVK